VATQCELNLKEDQTLLVFGVDKDGWLLVQEQDGGKVSYITGNYIEVIPIIIIHSLSTLR
jgi:hypothetical protein